MAEVLTLNAEPRAATGTKASRRLRREGIVPGNVYGHKQDPQAIQLKSDDVRHILHKGARVVDLAVGGNQEKALLSEVQWDTFSQHLLHVDFLRVDPDERVEVSVPVHLRGTAPGVLAGGILEQTHHELTVECLAVDIPTEIVVRIGSLHVGDTVHVSDLTELPTGVKVVDAPDTIVLHIIQPRAEEEAPEAAEGAPAEPEVIGRKKEEEGAEA
jgi:large subunit ribosomal protein L25